MLRTPFHDDAISSVPVVHHEPHPFPQSPTKHPAQQEYFRSHSLTRRNSVTLPDLSQLATVAISSIQSEYSHCSGNQGNYFDDALLIRAAQRRGHWMERDHRPSISLFHNNRDILPTMRCKLINWLIEVSLHFRLHKETFYLAVHYIDRFLSLHWGVHRSRLQLIGIASLFIAAKLEEIYPPKLREFAKVCDGGCTTRDIFCMELDILMSVQWKLNFPTLYYWLGSYLELLSLCVKPSTVESIRQSAMHLIDLAVHAPLTLVYPYSMIAAAALHIRVQDDQLVAYASGYAFDELQPCIDWLWGMLRIPQSIVYFDPCAKVTAEQFDDAVVNNTRIMYHLMVQDLGWR